MEQQLIKLDWDTDFFHFNVCRVNGSIEDKESLEALRAKMKEQNTKLAYFASTQTLQPSAINNLDIRLVDRKTTYIKRVNHSAQYQPSVCRYEFDVANEALLSLGVQSGAYSRFNVDDNIGQAKFEALYKLWVTKSVTKELAKEVFVHRHQDNITGFLTISEKNDRADFEMVAVDSNYRHKGIGTLLFKHAEKWSSDNGYEYIQIVTQGDNLPACKFYERMGCSVETMLYFYHIWRND